MRSILIGVLSIKRITFLNRLQH